MSILSVQQYAKGLLDGLPSAFYGPLQAFVAPPVPGNLDTPAAYLWGGVWPDSRQTMPRGPGFRKASYKLDCYLMMVDDPNASNADLAFPALIKAVVGRLATTLMPVQVADPVDGAVSQIVAVGEHLDVDYAPVVSLEDQRYVLYQALVKVDVEEAYQTV